MPDPGMASAMSSDTFDGGINLPVTRAGKPKMPGKRIDDVLRHAPPRFVRRRADMRRQHDPAIADQRFGPNNANLRNVRMDDNPGRNDWVTGFVDVRRRFGRIDSYRFSCSVNFESGRIRNAQIDQFEDRYYGPRGGE